MYIMDIYKYIFEKVGEFDWDTGNINKNQDKHEVNVNECEEVFFNTPVLIQNDEKHSEKEKRFSVLGRSNDDRYLYLVFTIRRNKIRVISARDQSKKERVIYKAMIIKEKIL